MVYHFCEIYLYEGTNDSPTGTCYIKRPFTVYQLQWIAVAKYSVVVYSVAHECGMQGFQNPHEGDQ